MVVLLIGMAALGFILGGCSAGEDDSEYREELGLDRPGFPGLPGNPGAPAMIDQGLAMSATESYAMSAAPQQPAAAAMPTPTVVAMMEVSADVGPAPPAAPAAAKVQAATAEESSERPVASLVAQQRIIVRTVDLGIVVEDVTAAIEAASNIAQDMGGWLVGSEHSLKHQGSVSVRVPANSLDDSIDALRDLAFEVDYEIAHSQDVTDEYVDLKSRMRNLEATENALLALFDRAQKVEDALDVQRELTRVQEQMEIMQGRIAYLEQTSAYSLLNVTLRLAPFDIRVDGGDEKTVSVGEFARFRATFTPPDDIDDFSFTWDFGDGSGIVTGHRVAPTIDGTGKVTATVTHVYENERDSPYIATVELTGTGDAGVAEGSDTVIVSVTRVPNIEVFAGEAFSVTAGEEFEVSGSFTRPAGLSNVAYSWDFGDGSEPQSSALSEGQTTASATHVYDNHRPAPYTLTLTVTASSEAGEIEASSETSVFVRESLGWTVGGWNPGEDGKEATRALSELLQGLTTLLIWAVIFSPFWLAAIAAIWYLVRRSRRYQARRQPPASPSRAHTGLVLPAPTRHFTATGFVVHAGHVLLHWHPKVAAWLPPGGHVEPNEDPVQAVTREVREEAGVKAEVVGPAPALPLDYPRQVQPPFTIMVEDIHDPVDGFHYHIDMIYFCRLVGPPRPLNPGWTWVSREVLASGGALQLGDSPCEPPPEDVRLLAELAFAAVED